MSTTPTKIETVHKLLGRKGGASISQLMAVTGWQAHTVRAALSGLRKRGAGITRSSNAKGVSVYRIAEERG
jgi:hypothetical protein